MQITIISDNPLQNGTYQISEEAIKELTKLLGEKLLSGPVKVGKEIYNALSNIGSLTDGSVQKLAESVLQFILRYYTSMSVPKRLSCMVGIRWLIVEGEKKYGDVARAFRPPSREDPIEHVVGVLTPFVHMVTSTTLGVVNNATITITIENTTIKSITCTTKSG